VETAIPERERNLKTKRPLSLRNYLAVN